MFLLNFIARLLYGNDAVDDMNKQPPRKPVKKRKRR